MARFECLVELIVLVCICAPLKAFGGATHASPEAELVILVGRRATSLDFVIFIAAMIVSRDTLDAIASRVATLLTEDWLVRCHVGQ